MKIQKILPISMACLFFAAGVHSQEPVKAPLNPQQVTDLFIKTLVHTDATAMKALNENQRPARAEAGNSGDFIDIEKMQETDRIYADHLAPKFLANMKLTVEEQKALLPDTVALLQSVRDAQKRTVCTTGEAKPQTEGVRQGVVSILVPFACKAVNPTEKVTAMMRRSVAEKWTGIEKYRTEVAQLTAAYQNAPLTQDFNGDFILQRFSKSTVWQNTFPRESLDISQALY